MAALTPAPGRYQLVPAMDPEHYAALYDDIKSAGVRVPIDVDEQGNILDGHHRKAIADELGKECPERIVYGLESDAAKEDYAITVNGARRQMSAERRRELATTSLKVHTRLSDREHARRCGVSHTYIANLREVLELAEAIERAPTRQSRSGGVYRGSGTGDGAATVGDGLATVANPSPGDNRADTPSDEPSADRVGPADASPEVHANAPGSAGSAPVPVADPASPDGRFSRADRPVVVDSRSAAEAAAGHDPRPAAALIDTPIGPITKSVADALDKHVPDPNPHAEWRLGYLKRVHSVHAVMRSKPEDVAEKADALCLEELAALVLELTEYHRAVTRAVMARTPNNVRQIRRNS